MNEDERAEQVELAAAGDQDALQRLLVHYHDLLRLTIDREIDGKFQPHLDPDDVLQAAYVAAVKTVAGCTFDGPGGFYKWLERIARNELSDCRRALKRRKRDISREVCPLPGPTDSYPTLVSRLTAPQTTPSRQLSKQEAVAAVMSSLARLPDDQRRVVTMRFLEGRSVADIAAVLGKTENAVHVNCHRGLDNLRRLMDSITDYLTSL